MFSHCTLVSSLEILVDLSQRSLAHSDVLKLSGYSICSQLIASMRAFMGGGKLPTLGLVSCSVFFYWDYSVTLCLARSIHLG